MNTSNTSELTRFRYAATLLGALAFFALAPVAAAHATDNEPTGPGTGCNYTDAGGDNIPIDDGQDVFVDGKIVSCRGGSIVVTTAPKRNAGSVRPQIADPGLAIVEQAPKQPVAQRPPLVTAQP